MNRRRLLFYPEFGRQNIDEILFSSVTLPIISERVDVLSIMVGTGDSSEGYFYFGSTAAAIDSPKVDRRQKSNTRDDKRLPTPRALPF